KDSFKDDGSSLPRRQTRPKYEVLKDGDRVRGQLLALRDKTLAKIVAEHRLITQSGRPAWTVSGGETPILTTSGTGAPSVSYKTFGTIVSCLPIVMSNGKI